MAKSQVAFVAVLLSVVLLGAIAVLVRSPPQSSEVIPSAPRSELASDEGQDGAALQDPTLVEADTRKREKVVAPPPITPVKVAPQAVSAKQSVSGRVLLASGSPARGASVALFWASGGEPDTTAVAELGCNADGYFTAMADEPGNFYVLAFMPGSMPATRAASIGKLENAHVDTIVLVDGADIAGHTSSGGQPIARAEMVAILDSDSPSIALQGGSFKWSQRNFEWSFVICDTRADGGFRMKGLRESDYKLRISAMRGHEWPLGFHTLASRTVKAPAEHADFDVQVASLRFHFTSEGVALEGVEAQLELGGWQRSQAADANGDCSFKIVPRADFKLFAAKPGYQTLRLDLNAPKAGNTRSESFDLKSAPKPGSLHVDFVTSDGAPVEEARFGFYDHVNQGGGYYVKTVVLKKNQVNRYTPSLGVHGEVSAPGIKDPNSIQGDRQLPGGTFVIESKKPGNYRVIARTGKQIGEDLSSRTVAFGEYCNVEFLVGIPETGEVHRTASVMKRGCLSVAVRNRSGSTLRPGLDLTNILGTDVDCRMVPDMDTRESSSSNANDSRGATRTRIYAGECDERCNLLVTSPGYRSQEFAVEFVPGKVTPIDVVLDPQ